MSIEVHYWPGEFVLILASVVRRGCEIERTAGEHILQIADEHTSVCGHKRAWCPRFDPTDGVRGTSRWLTSREDLTGVQMWSWFRKP